MNKNCNITGGSRFCSSVSTQTPRPSFHRSNAHRSEHLYATLRTDGSEAAERYAMACDGRCLALWNKYKDAAK